MFWGKNEKKELSEDSLYNGKYEIHEDDPW